MTDGLRSPSLPINPWCHSRQTESTLPIVGRSGSSGQPSGQPAGLEDEPLVAETFTKLLLGPSPLGPDDEDEVPPSMPELPLKGREKDEAAWWTGLMASSLGWCHLANSSSSIGTKTCRRMSPLSFWEICAARSFTIPFTSCNSASRRAELPTIRPPREF